MRLLTTLVGALVALAVPVISRAVPDTQDVGVVADNHTIPCGTAYGKTGLQGWEIPLLSDKRLHKFGYFRSIRVKTSCACEFGSNDRGNISASGYTGDLPGDFVSWQCEPRTPGDRPPQHGASRSSSYFEVKAADVEEKPANIERDTEGSPYPVDCGYAFEGAGLGGARVPLVFTNPFDLKKADAMSVIVSSGCTCKFWEQPCDYWSGHGDRKYQTGMMAGNLPFPAKCMHCHR